MFLNKRWKMKMKNEKKKMIITRHDSEENVEL